jgi:glycosyltransferase involved in cell wall biosynthesis
MHVLHVGKFYAPVSGGMERVVELLCRVTNSFVKNTVLAMNTGRETIEEEIDGVHVVRAGTIARVGSVHVAPSMTRWLRRLTSDVVVLHEPNPWALVSYNLARPPAPLFVWYHSDVVRPALQYALFYAPIARPVYRRAQRIVVSSPALAEHARVLQPYRDRVRVVPFAIEPAKWRATGFERSELEAAVTQAGGPFVLFVGRHVAYKGVDVLLRALASSDARAVIVGDGPKRTEWEALAQSLHLNGRALFTGDVSDQQLKILMHAASALVLPSVTRQEAFGYVQLEAMAAGKPVISTDLPTGVSWVNQDGVTGRVVRTGDVDDLRAAMVQMLASPDRAAQMGAAARRRVEEEFTSERLRERLRDLYSEAALMTCLPEGC